MSLVNRTCWVVGGVGVIGRALTKSLLRAGATVIVNSREQSRLDNLSEYLQYHENLVTFRGSLLPGAADKTVERVLENGFPLHHVIAHGAVRYWKKSGKNNNNAPDGFDETYSLDKRRLLEMNDEEFRDAGGHLASLHFSAARALLPRLEGISHLTGVGTSYTFVTGDGGGHPQNFRSAAGELNAHHVWGLAAAIRNELKHSNVTCSEIRVGLPLNRPEEERLQNPREKPLSVDIGNLCAGVVSSGNLVDNSLLNVASEAKLTEYLSDFHAVNHEENSETIVM